MPHHPPLHPITQVVIKMLTGLKVKRSFCSADHTQRYLRYHAKRSTRPLELPKLRSEVAVEELDGATVVRLNPDHKVPQGTVVFLPGGAYVRPPLQEHWRFADGLVQRSDWQIIVPIYPKAPRATVTDALAMLHQLMNEIHGPWILMGDSAGGGLALALTEELIHLKKRLPKHLILISPWLDIALRDPKSKELEPQDPILACEGLREIGRQWAGGLSTDDPRVSPLLGITPECPPMTLFTGTREIFTPDILTLHHKASSLGVDSTLIVGEGLFHCYPIFAIPEAQNALESILQRLLDS